MAIQSNYIYELNQKNLVKLVWEYDIIECRCMFSGCSSITEINFISFDTSKCIVIADMFLGCHSLTTLDLSSFYTLNVIEMANMFWDCIS